ncbi:MAG: MerR family transcriptional regulator [Candidatus Melainabacteria bacterium]|jgi:DNA-binding transcriptional MerR regulator
MKKVVRWNEPNKEKYWTREKAASELGVTVQSVRIYESKGYLKRIPFTGAGNIVYYDRSEVEEFKKLRESKLED